MVPLKLNKGRKSILGDKKMKKSILVAILFLFFISFIPLNAQWARTYGGSDRDFIQLDAIQQTSDGGYIVVGITESFGPSGKDVWVLKLSSTGAIEWQRAYGFLFGPEFANSIQQTSDGGYIMAAYTIEEGYDAWILKLSSTGAIEWQRTYGGDGNDKAFSIQQTSDGGYVFAGETSSFGAGGLDFWIVKLNRYGVIEWQHTYGGSHTDCSYYIQQTSDGGYVVTGYTTSFGAGEEDVWVVKLSSTGAIEWQHTYGGSHGDCSYSIQQTTDGGYIFAGAIELFGSEDFDAWILKLSSTGAIEWQRTYGTYVESDYDFASSVQQTTDGGYIFVGTTQAYDVAAAWVLKLSSTGAIEWQRKYGGSVDDWGYSVQQTTDGGYVVAGITESFGAGTEDVLVLKLYSNGDIAPSCGLVGFSNASVMSTNILPVDTYVTAQSTSIVSVYSNISPLDTYASSNLLCEAHKHNLALSATTGGTIEPAPGTYTYYNGTQVQIEAFPNSGYQFSEWTGSISGTTNPITITMDSDKSVIANFIHAQEYNLTIAAGTGGTTSPSPGTYTHDSGTETSIQATPNSGYNFTGWTGNVPSGYENDNPIAITMDSDKSITANFVQQQYTLTIAAGTGGTTSPSPGTYIHASGAQVSIQATANSGYRFTSWTGDATGTTNPVTIAMDSDKSVTANFEATPTPPEPPPKPPDDGDGNGKGCFIATAAYGTPLHPHIDILRELRDKKLMTNKPGRTFVNFYYKYSPSIANFISKHKILKTAVRIHLRPLITFAYLTVH